MQMKNILPRNSFRWIAHRIKAFSQSSHLALLFNSAGFRKLILCERLLELPGDESLLIFQKLYHVPFFSLKITGL